MTPREVGLKIRELLLGLHASGHTIDDERAGHHNYSTDDLRRQALEYAGICSLSNGEMKPGCACLWSLAELDAQYGHGPPVPHGPEDRFTMSYPLCDRDGIVRSGVIHHGTDYQCTGHAHYGGEHIRCVSLHEHCR